MNTLYRKYIRMIILYSLLTTSKIGDVYDLQNPSTLRVQSFGRGLSVCQERFMRHMHHNVL